MTNIVTPKQTNFINTLLRERDVATDIRNLAAKVATTFEASMLIGTLLKAPKLAPKVEFAAPVSVPREQYLAALKDAEVSKYAIPTRYLAAAFPELGSALKNDLLFVEVKNYAGRKFFNRLTGAPGSFNRGRFQVSTATGLLKFINGRHVEFSSLFGQHYGVCGRCAAELTDQESRATGFGPTCRKVWGI